MLDLLYKKSVAVNASDRCRSAIRYLNIGVLISSDVSHDTRVHVELLELDAMKPVSLAREVC